VLLAFGIANIAMES